MLRIQDNTALEIGILPAYCRQQEERFLKLLEKSRQFSANDKAKIIQEAHSYDKGKVLALIGKMEEELAFATESTKGKTETSSASTLDIHKAIASSKLNHYAESAPKMPEHEVPCSATEEAPPAVSLIHDPGQKGTVYARYGFEAGRVRPAQFDARSMLSFLTRLRKYEKVSYELRLQKGAAEHPKIFLLVSVPCRGEKDRTLLKTIYDWHRKLLETRWPWVEWRQMSKSSLKSVLNTQPDNLTLLRTDLGGAGPASMPEIPVLHPIFTLADELRKESEDTFISFRFSPAVHSTTISKPLNELSDVLDEGIQEIEHMEREGSLSFKEKSAKIRQSAKLAYISRLRAQPKSWWQMEIATATTAHASAWTDVAEVALLGSMNTHFTRHQPVSAEERKSLYLRQKMGRFFWGEDGSTLPGITHGEWLAAFLAFEPDMEQFSCSMNISAEFQSSIPPKVEDKGIVLGQVRVGSQTRLIRQPETDRFMHHYLLGKSGTGKSTYMLNMIQHDVLAGNGLCLLDPHGELVNQVIERIPPSRLRDVVLVQFDDLPESSQGVFPISLFDGTLNSSIEFSKAISEHIDGMVQLFGDEIFSPRLQHYARGIINMLLCRKSEPGVARPLEIIKFVTSGSFAQKVYEDAMKNQALDRFSKLMVSEFWSFFNGQGSTERVEMIPYFQSKYIHLCGTSLTLNAFNQGRPAITVRDIMDGRKILLVNLSKGGLGPMDARMMGMTLISKIYLEAMRRARLPEEKRASFTLYVDEFHNYLTSSFEYSLAEVRKYKISLVLAHQYLSQLNDRSRISAPTYIKEAVWGGTATQTIFRVSAQDAELVSREFGGAIPPAYFTSLPNHRAALRYLCRKEINGPYEVATLPPPSKVYPVNYRLIRDYCATHYYGECDLG